MLGPLTDILNAILCLIAKFIYLIAAGVMKVINFVIVGLATILVTLFALLPDMPALPTLPTPFVTAEGWIAWFWPVGTTVAIFAFIFTAWLVWLGVSIVLRWAKGIST